MGFKSILCMYREEKISDMCYVLIFLSTRTVPLDAGEVGEGGKGGGALLEKINNHFNNLMYTKALV